MKLDTLEKDILMMLIGNATFLAVKKLCPIKPIVIGAAIINGAIAVKGVVDVVTDIRDYSKERKMVIEERA